MKNKVTELREARHDLKQASELLRARLLRAQMTDGTFSFMTLKEIQATARMMLNIEDILCAAEVRNQRGASS